MRPLIDVDLVYDDLRSLYNQSALRPVLDTLYALWVGGTSSRAHNARIGTGAVFLDDQTYLHLELVTRFKLNEEQTARLVALLPKSLRGVELTDEEHRRLVHEGYLTELLMDAHREGAQSTSDADSNEVRARMRQKAKQAIALLRS